MCIWNSYPIEAFTMSFYATIILAFALSMDAFAVAVCKGAALHKPPLREAFRTGLIFGLVEALTPLLGWAIGIYASQYVMRWDHWIAFALLFVLGARMIINGTKKCCDEDDDIAMPTRHSAISLVTTAIATSLDAMAIGVGLAFLEVNIVHTSMTIGLMTMIMATFGMILGRYIGPILGKRAEIVGGVALIAIGANIVLEHCELLMYAS